MDAPTPSPRVVRFEPAPRSAERVRVHLDDGSMLEVTREAVARAGLSPDDPVDTRLRASLEDSDLRWRAREAALGLLAHRPRARGELARRLRRKDFPGRIVADCLDALEAEGLVDDPEFARAWVRDRLRLKPRGRGVLLAELRRKGVGRELAEAAVDDVFRREGVREEELAVEVALGWLRRQRPKIRKALLAAPFTDERERARRRLVAYLGRRGFRGDTLHRGVEAAAEAALDG